MWAHIKKYSTEIYSIALCLTLGMLSGYISHAEPSTWYQNLIKPNFTPPSYVFSPVWIILYIMLGYALSIIYKQRQKDPALLNMFIIQFLLNITWSPLFFMLHRIDLAMFNILFLLAATIACIVKGSYNKKFVLVMIPYAAWIIFATVLTTYIYNVN